jgi:hypothetical protein
MEILILGRPGGRDQGDGSCGSNMVMPLPFLWVLAYVFVKFPGVLLHLLHPQK